MNRTELLERTYRAFNARDADAVLESMASGVDWPNGWEGGRLTGHEAVRDYWIRQWAAVQPTVTPTAFNELPDGRIAVLVHQRVTDLEGTVLLDQLVTHVYTFENGLIQRMDIEEVESAPLT